MTNTYKRYFVILISISILLIDVVIPLGVAIGVLYIVPIFYFVKGSVDSKKNHYWFVLLCSLFVLLGFKLSPEEGDFIKVIGNRILSLFIIWVSYSFFINFFKGKEKLKKSNKALLESIDELNNITTNSPLIIMKISLKGVIKYINKSITPNAELKLLIGRSVFDFVSDENQEIMKEKYDLVIKKRNTEKYSIEINKKDGKSAMVKTYVTPIVINDEVKELLLISEDISTLKNVESNLKKNKVLLEKAQKIAHIGHWKLNPKTMEVSGSDELYRIFGLKEEGVTLESFVEAVHPDDREMDVLAIQRGLEHAENWNIEHRLKERKGEVKWVRAIGEVKVNKKGGVIELIGTIQDITERKAIEQKLINSNSEKEILLKEVHHRVKNNLQIVWGLLDLQQRRHNDDEIILALKESKNRINSIALIHESLYRNGDFTMIRFDNYISKLVKDSEQIYNIKDKSIIIKLKTDGINLSLDKSIPLGLMLNEIISNCYKYAFKGRDKGIISIDFSMENKKNVLSVVDDGIGFILNENNHKNDGIGLKLISKLAKQIDGICSTSSILNQGTKYHIEFEE